MVEKVQGETLGKLVYHKTFYIKLDGNLDTGRALTSKMGQANRCKIASRTHLASTNHA
jgi:hypothetical protein